ncbi:hypothetical protein AAG906_023432 [Vitis piasezkii]|uniref:Light-regulated protein 1, chloroplastic n=2 Tax=Vitis vinifera TaxID=29760 RepID=A0A438JD14_VITVI|eukprot:XP_002275869.1 PREDICTED: light-regulated protein [Vitis vinifera]
MQAALCFAPTLLPLTPSRNFATPASSSPPKLATSLTSRRPPIKAAAAAYDSSTVDYNSMTSVFPAEACDVIGGEACLADCYPEVRLKQEARNRAARTASEVTERDYYEYNDAKTVFRAEACDDLGGLFCEREYQRGVY